MAWMRGQRLYVLGRYMCVCFVCEELPERYAFHAILDCLVMVEGGWGGEPLVGRSTEPCDRRNEGKAVSAPLSPAMHKC